MWFTTPPHPLERPRPSPSTPPSELSLFLSSPVLYLTHTLYRYRHTPSPPHPTNPITVVCVADTFCSSCPSSPISSDFTIPHQTAGISSSDDHKADAETTTKQIPGSFPELPAGDILLHAGNLTQHGTFAELEKAVKWLEGQPHEHKVVVAGWRDSCLDSDLDSSLTRQHSSAQSKNPLAANRRVGSEAKRTRDSGSEGDIEERERRRASIMWGSIHYLQDKGAMVKVRGRDVSVYGSPRGPKKSFVPNTTTAAMIGVAMKRIDNAAGEETSNALEGNTTAVEGAGGAGGARTAMRPPPPGAFEYHRCDDDENWKGRVPPGTDILLANAVPKTHMDGGGVGGCLAMLEEVWRGRPGVVVSSTANGHDKGYNRRDVRGWGEKKGHGKERVERLMFDGLQREVEQTVLDGGGWGNLWGVLKEWLWGMWEGVMAKGGKGKRHVLVDASLVGGKGEEEDREAVVLII